MIVYKIHAMISVSTLYKINEENTM